MLEEFGSIDSLTDISFIVSIIAIFCYLSVKSIQDFNIRKETKKRLMSIKNES